MGEYRALKNWCITYTRQPLYLELQIPWLLEISQATITPFP